MRLLIGVKSATYPDGTKLGDVIVWNNYGTPTIPPRPVFNMAGENVLSRDEIQKAFATYLHNVIENPADAGKLEQELFRKIGVQMLKEIRNLVKSAAVTPENAPATVAKKGFNKPLYESGLFLKNLGFEYDDEGE